MKLLRLGLGEDITTDSWTQSCGWPLNEACKIRFIKKAVPTERILIFILNRFPIVILSKASAVRVK